MMCGSMELSAALAAEPLLRGASRLDVTGLAIGTL
jgi:hypothetical protein